jgi:DNA-binding response OmpR family regulator
MRILIVEDEHKIAASLEKGLEQESYAVDLAYTGEEGLDLALGEEYDIIILDRMIPGIDGQEICKRIRKQGIHTPVLFLTAKGQLQDKIDGLNAGGDDYLVKPFAFEELLARLRALSRRPQKNVGHIFRSGELSLDTLTFEVKREQTIMSLSSKEFALLEFLLRNEGKTLSKEKIIAHVWDYEADVLPNTVEVYIGYLRNKIDKGFSKKLIHTVRGFGYKIGQ